ncbi:MAG: DUF948 domain-containing protein [Coriobacteriia bacterium]|nr:DUF948 domain-containing protein [Coriobacteriia bacterium]
MTLNLDTILEYALPIALVLLAVVAIWLVIEAALTMRSTRSAVNTMNEQLKPTLEKVDQATAALIPAVEKMDPLMDRVNLSVDALNLELMRVDTILEETGEIAKNLNTASDAVANLANAPQDAITQVSDKVRKAFSPRAASNETKAIGARKEAAAKKAEKPVSNQQVVDAVKSVIQPAVDAVQSGAAQEAAEQKVAAAVNRINAAAQTAKATAQEVAATAKAGAKDAAASAKSAKDAAAVKIAEAEPVRGATYYTYESDALSVNGARMTAESDQQ